MRTRASVGLAILLTSAVALAGEGQIEIGPTAVWPIVISQPGSYLLTSDLSPTGVGSGAIQIGVANVILDLGGHFIHGGGILDGAPGVKSLSGLGGITVRNGVISNFDTCLSLVGAVQAGNSIESVSVSGCDTGIEAVGATISNSRASGCGMSGISATEGSVSASDARHNYIGFALTSSTCTGCTSDWNSATGFFVQSSVCAGCRAAFNSGEGYNISNGGNLLTASSAQSNGMGSLAGTCTSAGNACFNSLLP